MNAAAPRNVVLYELNEVPFRIIEEYCRWRPDSHFARLLPRCERHATQAPDKPLSPWITWPTVHRGVGNDQHGIRNFGQDLREVDERFPPVWRILAKHGVKVGVLGSLHTYPPPPDRANYLFYVPDTFAPGSECLPADLDAFQDFNLTMARASARNVSRGVPWKAAARFLAAGARLGLRLTTCVQLFLQLVDERIHPERKGRRRTFQSLLAFDVFMQRLRATRPAFATYFTNHVASAMHRFWAAAFPGDYASFEYGPEWVAKYKSEIRYAMDHADGFLGRLAEFADANPEYVIWIATSMGQAARSAKPTYSQLCLTEPRRFMRAMGLGDASWQVMPAMVPQFNVKLAGADIAAFRAALQGLRVQGEAVKFREGSDGLFSVDFGQRNLPATAHLERDGVPLALDAAGFTNLGIEDESDSSAYHVPEGCFIVYDPRNLAPKPAGAPLSTLDLAPLLLRNYGVPLPDYMRPAPDLTRAA